MLVMFQSEINIVFLRIEISDFEIFRDFCEFHGKTFFSRSHNSFNFVSRNIMLLSKVPLDLVDNDTYL